MGISHTRETDNVWVRLCGKVGYSENQGDWMTVRLGLPNVSAPTSDSGRSRVVREKEHFKGYSFHFP